MSGIMLKDTFFKYTWHINFCFHFLNIHIIYMYAYLYEEGTGDPLQYSCPETPMDGGA